MRTSVRRAVAGLTTNAVLLGGALTAAPASAVTARADAASDWLAGEPRNGLLVSEGFNQYGPTLDAYFAFQALGTRKNKRAAILDAFESRVGAYVGGGAESYAGATGKLVTALHAEGIDPAEYADGRLVVRLRALVRTAPGPQQGRASDRSEFGDFSNTLGQSWVVRALAAEDRIRLTGLTARFLVRQQCDAGFFRESLDSAGFTCETGRAGGGSEPSVDATALAVTALKAARRAGVPRLGDDIRDAVRWLRRAQNPNGSFTGNGVPNANTTGLVAGVLTGTRWRGAAASAGRWLSKRQVTARRAAGTGLEEETGAVAYDRTAWRTAADHGIAAADRIQWQLATAQAAPGLDALLPATRVHVRAPRRVGTRDTVVVRVRGLAPGEGFTLRRNGRKVDAGRAGRKGRAVLELRAPRRPKQLRLVVVGSSAGRSGRALVTVR